MSTTHDGVHAGRSGGRLSSISDRCTDPTGHCTARRCGSSSTPALQGLQHVSNGYMADRLGPACRDSHFVCVCNCCVEISIVGGDYQRTWRAQLPLWAPIWSSAVRVNGFIWDLVVMCVCHIAIVSPINVCFIAKCDQKPLGGAVYNKLHGP